MATATPIFARTTTAADPPIGEHRFLLRNVGWAGYEALLELLGDEKLMADFRRGVKEVAEGKLIPWEKTRKELLRDL